MSYTRKHLGSGQLDLTETTIYTPASSSVTGVIGSLTLYNTSSTTQVTVTIYAPHSGVAAGLNVLEKVVINPEKTHRCNSVVNKVIEGGNLISALADTAAVINFDCSGAEE